MDNTLEKRILLLQKKAETTSVNIGDVIHIFSGKGRFMLLIFLSLPFCLPIQIPGLSTPFGLIIAFMGIQIMAGKQLWLPKKILSKTIASSTLKNISKKGLKIVRKCKPWIRPRLLGLSHHPVMHSLNGILIFALGLFLAFPLPIPFSNLLAAWPLLLMALGLTDDDGVFLLAGYFFTLILLSFIVFSIEFLIHHK